MITIKNYSDKYHRDIDYKVNLPCWISPRGKIYKPNAEKSGWKFKFAQEKTGASYYDAGVELVNKNWARIDMSHSRPDYTWYIMYNPKGLTKTQEKTLKDLKIEIYDCKIFTHEESGKRYNHGKISKRLEGISHTENVRNFQKNFKAELDWYVMIYCQRVAGMVEFNEIDSIEDAVKLYSAFVSCDMNEQRIELHKRLCELLKVKYEDFKPFEDIGITELLTEKEAQRILNKAIKKLRDNQ